MSNPYSGFFDYMAKVGLPHIDDDEHCWCRPVIITLATDINSGYQDEIIFHNYAGKPLTDDEIHEVFRAVLQLGRYYDQNP